MTYLPDTFREDDRTAQHTLIADYNFGLLITTDGDVLQVAHLPFLFDATTGESGHLKCHVARANPIWRGIESATVLSVFTGPHTYVSPDWYASEGLVPTWNYMAAYVRGDARIMSDAELVDLLDNLVLQEEQRLGNEPPWSGRRIPPDSHADMRKAIVGIDIAITGIDGKKKMSQNRVAADRAGVVAALQGLGSPGSLAVASLIEIPET